MLLINWFEVWRVAPLAGAWIEIRKSWVSVIGHDVAPLAGAWIEMFFCEVLMFIFGRRTPRGCVD